MIVEYELATHEIVAEDTVCDTLNKLDGIKAKVIKTGFVDHRIKVTINGNLDKNALIHLGALIGQTIAIRMM